MSSTPRPAQRPDFDGANPSSTSIETPATSTYAAPTYASFSPTNLSTAPSAAKRRSTILVHQKSPLLLATPPQITRALAYSHPFLLPLNKLAGLLTWTSGDQWQSFLLLVVFWAVVAYGGVVIRYAGPIVTVLGLIAGMYGRRYSPLSSSGWTEHPSMGSYVGKAKAPKDKSAGAGAGPSTDGSGTRHQKTLDEIVDNLKIFTTRCNILLEPLLELTDFLSTQRTATSATTRPALTTLFVRIVAITPIWVALTLPPLRIITTKRVVFVFGTLVLTWHSKPCRVTRTLLWRSATVRQLARWVTGLEFQAPMRPPPKQATTAGEGGAETAVPAKAANGKASKSRSHSALTEALRHSRLNHKNGTGGVRFTFVIYENQRRWVGLGWTASLFAYERSAWTDEQNNPVTKRDEFELPEVEEGTGRWRWVEGSKWRVDGVPELESESEYDTDAGRHGWVYYDNKWQNGRRGQDGWGRWTRRRKWYRDAELVEVSQNATPSSPTPPELPIRPRATSAGSMSMSTATLIGTSVNSDKAEGFSTSVPTGLERSGSTAGTAREGEDGVDEASVLSDTSGKSKRFRILPGFGGGTSTDKSKAAPALKRRTTDASATSARSRTTSEAASIESEDARLTPQLQLEIQGLQKDQDAWGIGDEAAMSFD